MKTRLSVYTAICVLGALSYNSQACEFHDGSMFGGFSMNHPLMQRHQMSAPPAKITLLHKRFATVKPNELQTIDINYHLPANFLDVTLQFTASEGIELEQQGEVALNTNNGRYPISFSTASVGEHMIEITAAATKNGEPYAQVQRIRISSQ